MATTIQKWGNSLAVRIPKELIRRLALKEGSGVVVREEREAIIIRPQRLTDKDDWGRFVIPTKRRKENVSGLLDALVYGASH
mgnify:CR=1 FL=1